MASYSQNPGRLNLILRAGDDFSTTIDFDVSLTGHTAQSSVYSAVTGETIASMTTAITNASAGQVSVSMNSTQTLSLAPGTYNWAMTWNSAAGRRTPLSGAFEVTR